MNHILRAMALALAALTAFSASAQAWPDRPVTLVVPFPAGGSTDQVVSPCSRTVGRARQAAPWHLAHGPCTQVMAGGCCCGQAASP